MRKNFAICAQSYNHNGDLCEHIRDCYYDDQWCEPEDTLICSICGHDYKNPNACPHFAGETYNEIVCTVTRICSICGNDYDDGTVCSHHLEEIYGSTECIVSDGRICNICGNNYSNGRVCPHVKGTEYGGDICSTTNVKLCNICGNNYNDANVCCHYSGEFYEDIAYFFYLPEWRKEAETETQRLAMKYSLLENHVILVEVVEEQQLVDSWNQIGRVDGIDYYVSAVVMDTHGDKNMLTDNINIYLYTSEIESEMNNKKMDRLILLGCNVGELKSSDWNVAATFARKINGAPVIASDGTVAVYEKILDLAFIPIEYQSCGEGWFIYRYVDNNIIVSGGKGKSLTLNQLLSI